MAIDYASLEIGELYGPEVLKEAQVSSAANSLAKPVGPLGIAGLRFSKLSGGQAYGIGEGGKKVASGVAESVVVKPNKIHRTQVLTEEAIAGSPQLWTAVKETAPSDVAKAFDSYVLGLTALPDDWAGFRSFSELTNEVEVPAGADAAVALDDAVARVKDGAANGLLITSAMLAYLRRQRIGATGARVFDITADQLEGINYKVVNSSERVAVAGNFQDAAWSAIDEFTSPVTGEAFRVKDSGEITDSLGVVHNLTDSNKYALIYEVLGGFNFDDDFFTRLVPAEAGE